MLCMYVRIYTVHIYAKFWVFLGTEWSGKQIIGSDRFWLTFSIFQYLSVKVACWPGGGCPSFCRTLWRTGASSDPRVWESLEKWSNWSTARQIHDWPILSPHPIAWKDGNTFEHPSESISSAWGYHLFGTADIFYQRPPFKARLGITALPALPALPSFCRVVSLAGPKARTRLSLYRPMASDGTMALGARPVVFHVFLVMRCIDACRHRRRRHHHHHHHPC